MFEIYQNLFIGNESDCFFDNKEDWAVIHACKIPCHQRAVGYTGNLDGKHPNYLILERGKHLFLNIVDMERPLLHKFAGPIIEAALAFIEKNIITNNLLIHCNQGLSRAPSIGLIFLAKRTDVISNVSYREAAQDFLKIYGRYQPSRGIAIYLSKNWKKII